MNLSSKELKCIARANLTRNYQIPMKAMISVLLLTMAIELPFSVLLQTEHPTMMQNIIYYIVEFLISLISGVLQIGLMQLHLSIARKQQFSHQQIYCCFKNQTDRYIISIFIIMLMTLLCSIPGFAAVYLFDKNSALSALVSVGFLGLISILLIIMIQLIYRPVYYLLLDHPEWSVRDVFKQSRQLMKGQKRRLLYIYVSFLGMTLLEILSLGIGALWIEPYKSQTFANFYLDIIGEFQSKQPLPPTYQPFNQYI